MFPSYTGAGSQIPTEVYKFRIIAVSAIDYFLSFVFLICSDLKFHFSMTYNNYLKNDIYFV